MKRTPIILIGQVYLHTELNEYLVVTKSNQGEVQFKGQGFCGMSEAETFLERTGPVDPVDLTEAESKALVNLLSKPGPLLVGWVPRDDDDEEE
jgi:hypothetical protein